MQFRMQDRGGFRSQIKHKDQRVILLEQTPIQNSGQLRDNDHDDYCDNHCDQEEEDIDKDCLQLTETKW